MRVYQSFPALTSSTGRAGPHGGYFGVPKTVGFCEELDAATDAPFCYPPKDVQFEFEQAGKEMSFVCTKGSIVRFTHQTFWWYYIQNMATQARNSVIAAAGGIATASNWRRVIALAECRHACLTETAVIVTLVNYRHS